MSEEALAKAREIAARLAGILNLNTELYIAYNLQFFQGESVGAQTWGNGRIGGKTMETNNRVIYHLQLWLRV